MFRSYCEAPVGEFINPGDFNLLTHGHKHRHEGGLGSLLKRTTSSSSSSSDEETRARHADETISPGGTKKKPGLLQRIIHH